MAVSPTTFGKDITLEKQLPHSVEAECAVLGAILLDNQLFDQANETISSEDFYVNGHRRIFEKMASLSAASKAIDSVTLAEELQKDGVLEEVGGVSYVASLMDGVPRTDHIEHYVHIVRDKSLIRRLIHSANEVLVRGFSNEEDPAELLEMAERAVFEIGQSKNKAGFVQIDTVLSEAYREIESLSERQELISGLASGFVDLDSMTSGFQNSDLIIVAARPGLGKTSLALNVAQYVSSRLGKVAGIFSLEMSANQLVKRLLCGEARVDSHKLRSGYLGQEDWKRLAKALPRLSQSQIFIDDTAGLTISEMRSKARRLKAEHGLDLLVVDYLQLMSGRGLGGRGRQENRQQEISAISRSLKALAKELDVPLLAISQLSRAPEQRRGDHKPQLSDLRESGSIEQDADLVMFIYREDIYKKPEELDDSSGVAEIIIGKQRNGPTGSVKLAFIEEWTKFENLARA